MNNVNIEPGYLEVRYIAEMGDAFYINSDFLGTIFDSGALSRAMEYAHRGLIQLLVNTGHAEENDPNIIPIDLGDESV